MSLIVLSAPYKKINWWEIVWYWRQWQIYIVTIWTHAPGLIFFIFMQFSGKFWSNIRLALLLGLGTPLGNPGSAPGKDYLTHRFENVQIYIIFYGSDNPVGIIQSLTLKQISSAFLNTGDCDFANRRVQSISMV